MRHVILLALLTLLLAACRSARHETAATARTDTLALAATSMHATADTLTLTASTLRELCITLTDTASALTATPCGITIRGKADITRKSDNRLKAEADRQETHKDDIRANARSDLKEEREEDTEPPGHAAINIIRTALFTLAVLAVLALTLTILNAKRKQQ